MYKADDDMFIFTLNMHIKRRVYCENSRFMEQHKFIGFSIGPWMFDICSTQDKSAVYQH
jgi:hypothetical protein